VPVLDKLQARQVDKPRKIRYNYSIIMAKKKIEITIYSYGLYTSWNSKGKGIPKPIDFTTEIPITPDVEFGLVLKILNGRREKITYRTEHPPFKDETGKVMPPFTGVEHIKENYYLLFIGDTVWDPIEDKAGRWRITCYHNEKIVAEKVFNLFMEK